MSSNLNRQPRSAFSVDSPLQTVVWVILVAALSYLAAKLGGTVVMRPQVDWPLWLGNVLLVSILLLVRRRVWLLLMTAAFSAFALYDVQSGIAFRSIALLILSDFIEVLTAAWGLSYAFGELPRLDSMKALAKYVFFAVVLAPFTAAFVGALASSGGYWASWRISFFSEALAFLTLLPAILSWVSKGASWTREPLAYRLEAVALLVALVLLGSFSFVSSSMLVLSALPVVPLLLWAALRFGTTGVSSAMVVLVFLSIWGAINGRGPFVEMGALNSVMSLQAFLLFAAAPFMVLAALVEERKPAEESRFRLASIVESSDDAIISKNLNGVIVTWNRGAQRIFGFSEAEAVGQPITILLPPDLQEEEQTILRNARVGEKVEHFETVRMTKEGTKINVSLTISPLRDATGRIIGSSKIARDITGRIRAEEELKKSERRFRLMADSAPMLVWLSGPDKLAADFNSEWLKFTGRTMQQELGNGWTHSIHPDDLRRRVEAYAHAFEKKQKFTSEYRMRRYDGQYRWMLDQGVPRFLDDGSFAGYVGYCLDISDQKETKAARIELSGRLIHAQEEERARIARELHDDINQRLALLANGVQEFEQATSAGRDPLQTKQLRELWQLTTDIATAIERMSYQLHPSKLHYLGLASAVRDLCQEFSRQHKIEVECVVRDLPQDLDENVSLSLFRTVQESLRNVVKHSHSRHAKVELTRQAGVIHLQVSDDGLGFNPDQGRNKHGLGLVSMGERLRSVGGEFSIWSKPSMGTQVKGTAPATTKAAPRAEERAADQRSKAIPRQF
jgi:PAS domain S-box-containing protein